MATKLQQPAKGSVFGRLTVLGRAPNAPFGSQCTRVRCACGTERAVVLSLLLRGVTKTCGCHLTRRDLKPSTVAALAPGAVHGRLTVLRVEGEGKRRLVRCVCACGRKHSIRGPYRITTGLVRSCGCLSADRTRERAKQLRAEALGGHVQHAGGR